MSEFLLKVPRTKKGKALLDFLREIDFISIEEFDRFSVMKDELAQSLSDLKKGKARSWYGKKIKFKNA